MENSEIIQHCEDLIAAGASCIPHVKQDDGSTKPEPIIANVVCATAVYIEMIVAGYKPKEPGEAIAFIIRMGDRLTADGLVPNSQV